MAANVKKIALKTPLMMGDKELSEIALRKPTPGDCRGLSLQDIAAMEMDTYATFLPRIASPSITEDHVMSMELGDVIECMRKVNEFLSGN